MKTPHSLLAYDGTGRVLETLDLMVARDESGAVVGLIDFAAHEAAGGEHTDIWQVPGASGSKVWREFLGTRAHGFRVERDGPPSGKRIVALVHLASGHRRERAAINAAIEERLARTPTGTDVDLRDLIGGPDRPLFLDDDGRTIPHHPVRAPRLPRF